MRRQSARSQQSPQTAGRADRTAAFILFLAASSLAEYPPPSHAQRSAPVGAKLNLFADRWLASSPYLGAAARDGVWIQWLDGTPPPFMCGNARLDKEKEALFDEEVGSLLAKNAITQVPMEDAYFVCSLFLVDKKGGGLRPCLNLKPLNVFTRPKHFKM